MFDLQLGELINLIFCFCVDEQVFFTLSDGCHGNKNIAFLQLP